MQDIRIAGISERDTDLMLLEEFVSSPAFGEFFVRKTGACRTCRLLNAARSVTSANGESDLEVVVESQDGKRILLLVENKVNAGFQPNQAIRYRERGQAYVQNGKADSFFTVLVAPQRYFPGDTKGFDARLNYEDIRDFIAGSHLSDGRKRYKTALLAGAIEKSTAGYQMVADAAVSDFWRDYWRLSLEVAPDLRLERPDNKPAGAGFVYFYRTGLPKAVVPVHKLPHGYFDLQFASMGSKLNEMHAAFDSRLETGMTIEKAAKSASVRLRVPVLSTADPLDRQREAAIQGFEGGKKLVEWARNHIDEAALNALRGGPIEQ